MNTVNCSCGCQKPCGCQFNPCAVTCGFPDAKEYGYVYNTTAETVAAGSAVTFASNGALSGNINHTAGTAEIVVTATGVYLVEFYIDCSAENTFTLYQNGSAVAGSTYTGTAENSGKIIVTAQKGDVFTLVDTGAAEVTFDTGGNAVNAALIIQKVF